MKKRWNVLAPCPADFTIGAEQHPVIPHLLWHRGIRTAEDAEAFFKPSFSGHVHDPFLFSNMEVVVRRMLSALDNGESVVVFGDYDADGLTSSAVIISTMKEIHRLIEGAPDFRVRSYLPHRDKEGYGLQMTQVERFIEEGVNLIVTVDCGIACVDEIERLKSAGIDVIVIDHHQFGERLPDALLIHPGLPRETYPFKHLAAVGVAWKVATALVIRARERGIEVPEGFEKWLLDLVAIATVTDIVPLIGENRALEHFGLVVLNRTRRPGLQAIIRRAGLPESAVTARDIGFGIGPRLNAPSRMDHASVALSLLLAESDEEADFHAAGIELLNRSRQEATLGMMREAEKLLESFSASAPLHVLWRDDWSPALVGLVAGKISDRFGVPVVAIGKHAGTWIGSGRSLPCYDITEAVKRAGEGLLMRAGGHAQACGFALVEDENVPVFAERLRADAKERLLPANLGPSLDIHAELSLKDLTWRLLDALASFEPFGAQNPSPVFVTRNVEIVTSSTVGQDGKHLRFLGRTKDSTPKPFIAFGMGSRVSEASHGRQINVAYRVSINEWNGRREIQCKVEDFQ